MKQKILILVFLTLLFALAFGGCNQKGNLEETDILPPLDSGEETELVIKLSGTDSITTWSDSDTKINLNDSTATITGPGATVNNGVITITAKGTYVISGTLSDGQIRVAADKTEEVHLVLKTVDITNKTGAPIYASGSDKLIITLAEGTENTLTDGGADFFYADAEEKEPNAALFSKNDLTINGTGSLIINAGFNNGIVSKDDLLIVSGQIKVTAANHGIRGNDAVEILDGKLDITAGKDGIQTNNTKDITKGRITIEKAAISITAGHDGIQADTSINIAGGDFNITTGTLTSADNTSDSFKGIKADGDILITGGTFFIESKDDGIHSNGNITIDGGDFTISTVDDGIHADASLTINEGIINVTKAYEGLEAANIIITGGEIRLKTSDDAINAAGGSDFSGGFFWKENINSGNNYSIDIRGGNIIFLAGGDGLDSNGSIKISGGKIVAIIDSTPDNGALDADGGIYITGGTIFYGGSGVGPAPNSSSTQSYVFINSTITNNTTITVKKGTQTLLDFTPTTTMQYLALSSPEIIAGEKYDIYLGNELLSTVTAGEGGTGIFGGRPGGVGKPR